IPDAYAEEVEAAKDLEVVSQPKIDVIQMEQGKNFIFTAEVALKPPVDLGKYKGVKIEKIDTEVTDEDIDKEIKREQEANARTITVEDRPVKDGDTAVIDFEGFIGDEAFEGGKGENYPLELGSGSFIPGFEEQVAGHKVDEEFDVNVTFPEEYAEELAGKDATFKCVIHEIKTKELPELDDEFAKDVSEFDTLDEYKADLKKQLDEKKAEDSRIDLENKLIEQVVDNMECDVPECMFENRVNEMLQDYGYRLQMQGIDLNTYLQYMGQDMEQFKETFREGAESQVRASIALEAIVDAEKIEVTDEEIEAEIEKLAKQYQMEADQIKAAVPADQLSADVKTRKALDIVVESAITE
ncbi:MAG: trigger factor, partial [Eubacterium sp.]|nr:trigger factor [Eubacterium sp.]